MRRASNANRRRKHAADAVRFSAECQKLLVQSAHRPPQPALPRLLPFATQAPETRMAAASTNRSTNVQWRRRGQSSFMP